MFNRKEYMKNYKRKNNEKYKKYMKKYHKDHKEEKKKYDIEYRRKNAEIIHKKMKDYYSSPKGIYQILKNNIRTYNFKGNKKIKLFICKEDFIQWYNNQKKVCYYCGKTLKEIKLNKKDPFYKNRLSIDRKNNNGNYCIDNIVLACYRCNTIKGDFFTEQEMLKIGNIIKERGRNG